MKTKLAILALLASFSVAGFAADTSAQTKDREILGTLVALNKNEIAAAKEVEKSKISADVKKFADFMIVEHGKNLRETMKLSRTLGKPENDKKALMLKAKGLKELASLKITKEKNMNKTYIDDMVADHESALELVDNDLLKNVTNAKLKKHLEMTREHIAHHLDEAKAIQAKL
jgi:putative membrane protein